jgi:protein-L-isoaspartate(D-aspartate) O-methyltransferase
MLKMADMKKKLIYFLLCMMVPLIFGVTCRAENPFFQGFEKRREHMVRTQIEARGITNKKVLKALREVERHKFVPKEYQWQAYGDHPLPIGEGQTISQPYIIALMTEVLDLDSTKKVLEIGTGSGYQAAILAEICHSVCTIELIDVLGKKAEKLLADLGYENIKIKIGDGYQGWKEYSPFDAIIVTCAPSHIPQPLKDQLAEGGKMVIPVGKKFTQELVLLNKQKGEIKARDIIPVRFVPMMGKDGTAY